MAVDPTRLREALIDHGVRELFHLTHLANLASIAQHGIRPKNDLAADSFIDISMASVQARRDEIGVLIRPDLHGPARVRPLHGLVPLFPQPKNPMLYKLRDQAPEFALIAVDALRLCDGAHEIAFSDGNMGSPKTKHWVAPDRLDDIPWDVLRASTWTDHPDGKRKRCAEFLVYPCVEPHLIKWIEVSNPAARRRVIADTGERISSLRVTVEPNRFFRT